jgi:hypothetical protein
MIPTKPDTSSPQVKTLKELQMPTQRTSLAHQSSGATDKLNKLTKSTPEFQQHIDQAHDPDKT